MKRISMFVFSAVLLSAASNCFCAIRSAKKLALTKEDSGICFFPEVAPKGETRSALFMLAVEKMKMRNIDSGKKENPGIILQISSADEKEVVDYLLSKGYKVK